MGAMLEKCLLFPAPSAQERRGGPCSPNIIWDRQPVGTPGGGACRPFLWLQTPRAQVTVIYCHANAEDLDLIEPWLQNLSTHLSINILAFEYPGYGLLQDPAIMDDLDTATTIMQWIDFAAVHALQLVTNTLGICASKVLIYGRSLGSGPALRLARYVQKSLGLELGGVVLQSPFVSMRRVAADVAGAAGRLLISADYDNLQAVRDLCSSDAASARAPGCPPLLVLHGELDEVVAPYHGRMLHTEALRCGHCCAEAVFPHKATHEDWDMGCDIAPHIADFMIRHMLNIPKCAGQTDALKGEAKFCDKFRCCPL